MEQTTGWLIHSGTKGQKWGIRRYQNKDGSLTPEGRIHYGYGPANDSGGSSNSSSSKKGFKFKFGGKNKQQNQGQQTQTSGPNPNASGPNNSAQSANSNSSSSGQRNTSNTSTNQQSNASQSQSQQNNQNRPNQNNQNQNQQNNKNQKDQYQLTANEFKEGQKIAGELSKMASRDEKFQNERNKAAFDLSNLSDQDLRNIINRETLERQVREIEASKVNAGKKHLSDRLDTIGNLMAIGVSAATIASIVYQIKKG